MNPQENIEMTPEEAKASLGLATRLSEQMLMAQFAQTAPQDAQNGQGGEQMQGVSQDNNGAKDTNTADNKGIDNSEEKMDGKMEILRTELKDTIKVEIDSIKQMIKDALSEEKDNGEN